MCTLITRQPISNEEKIDNNSMRDDYFVQSIFHNSFSRMNDSNYDIPCGPFDFQQQIHNVSRVDYLQNLEENEDMKTQQFLNLEPISQNKAHELGLVFSDDISYNSSTSAMTYDDNMDKSNWMKKRIEDWTSDDTTYWYLETAGKIGATIHELETFDALPGIEFLQLSRDEFLMREKEFGHKFYDELHKRHITYLQKFDSPFRKFRSDDESSTVSMTSSSDGESTMVKTCVKKRPPGRPPTRNPKVKVEKEKLWQFVRNLLLSPKTCPSLIRWVDYDKKRFAFVKSDQVAKLWGARKHNKDNKDMNYEKFSRAMRYYYEKDIFRPVIGRRLVYDFGKNATGLETKDPNFENLSQRMARARL